MQTKQYYKKHPIFLRFQNVMPRQA